MTLLAASVEASWLTREWELGANFRSVSGPDPGAQVAQEQSGKTAQFAAELRVLYEAAGKPTYAAVCHQAKAQHPPVRMGTSTLSAWLKGDNVPADPRAVTFLIGYLANLAKRRDRNFETHPSGRWDALYKAAVEEKRAGRGRGGRPASDSSASGRFGAAGALMEQKPPREGKRFQPRYSHQVRQIFAGELLDREAELAA